MAGWRIASVSLMLLFVGALLARDSRDLRRTGMSNYAAHGAYNQALADFVVRHRDQIAGRPVAVLGVSGLSPWSQTGGSYINRLLGAPHEWNVFVPRPDPYFYPAQRVPHWQVVVRPEVEACALPSGTMFFAFDPQGQGLLSQDCHAALAFAHPRPVIDEWGPKSVTPAQVAKGFDMIFRGRNLTNAVAVMVDGQTLDMVRGPRFDVMTTTVPPRKSSAEPVTFRLLHRNDVVLEAAIPVKAQVRP